MSPAAATNEPSALPARDPNARPAGVAPRQSASTARSPLSTSVPRSRGCRCDPRRRRGRHRSDRHRLHLTSRRPKPGGRPPWVVPQRAPVGTFGRAPTVPIRCRRCRRVQVNMVPSADQAQRCTTWQRFPSRLMTVLTCYTCASIVVMAAPSVVCEVQLVQTVMACLRLPLPPPRSSMASGDYTLSDFDFDLPPDLIAQTPPAERTDSRLLHVAGESSPIAASRDLPALVRAGDLLVFNDTRVVKSRLVGTKPTGGRVELLLERVLSPDEGAVPDPCQPRPPSGAVDSPAGRREAVVVGRHDRFFRLRFAGVASLADYLAAHGAVPLPPYICARRRPGRRSPLPDRLCPAPRRRRRADRGPALRRADARRAAARGRRARRGSRCTSARERSCRCRSTTSRRTGCMPSGT